MYAIIEDGSHQFRVKVGDVVQFDFRKGDPGTEVTFSKVLLVAGGEGDPKIGAPVLDGASVVGKIVQHYKTKKIVIQKFRRRKNMRRRNGHRQPYTMVRITAVNG